jgi:putative transposase
VGQPHRNEFPGARVHVVARAVSCGTLFVDDADRRRFLRRLAVVVDRYDWICTAYCLMRTHYHLIVQTPRPNLAFGIQDLNSVYARGFNLRHGRHGHVFSERYDPTHLRDDAHLLRAHRYVVRNPVEAGLRTTPEAWRFSSYRATAGLAPAPAFLTVDPLLALFGRDRRRARQRYRAFVADEAGDGYSSRRAA